MSSTSLLDEASALGSTDEQFASTLLFKTKGSLLVGAPRVTRSSSSTHSGKGRSRNTPLKFRVSHLAGDVV